MTKSNRNTDLAAMIPTRLAPPPAIAPTEAERAATSRQANRATTMMVAGHFEPDVSFALKSLCGHMSAAKGKRVTVQLALAEALSDLFTKYGTVAPVSLSATEQNAPLRRAALR